MKLQWVIIIWYTLNNSTACYFYNKIAHCFLWVPRKNKMERKRWRERWRENSFALLLLLFISFSLKCVWTKESKSTLTYYYFARETSNRERGGDTWNGCMKSAKEPKQRLREGCVVVSSGSFRRWLAVMNIISSRHFWKHYDYYHIWNTMKCFCKRECVNALLFV